MILEKIIFTLLFKWKYLIAILHSKFLKKNKKSVFTSITYVAREADKDWIFGAPQLDLFFFRKSCNLVPK